ncbi:unnamed protein product [Tuber melanosporum]|uniref:(Perigord truffle) hypothetical protein n=1 Tax=Tuber melanosporum (strain Mel28) TaxID=656061 RepID=D5GKN0_TUBMM|nr:uncharacterized protein GSTUM_00009653001 [Tuber melanosporum]CAZ85073.1 unnamed protein product [Tuber melanosporum]
MSGYQTLPMSREELNTILGSAAPRRGAEGWGRERGD